MGAECEKHGVDLHGDTHSGLVCPVCERETEVEALREALRELYDYVVKLEQAYGGQAAVRSYMQKPERLYPGVGKLGQRVRALLHLPEPVREARE